jgi:DUF2934 family protein
MDSTKLLDDEPGTVPYETIETEEDLSYPSHEEISELAYSYWEERGFEGGDSLNDWLRAEQELKKKYAE